MVGKVKANLSVQVRAQIVSLRRGGMLVSDICNRLGLSKSSEREAVLAICEALPRRYSR